MQEARWVDYSGAAPILLPKGLLRYWKVFYLPAVPGEKSPDLELPEGLFTICNRFDFVNPKTDYDRACALGGIPAVQTIAVGPGHGLVFATELNTLTWWPEQRMLVNGGSFPDLAQLPRVNWSTELVFRATEPDFVLMKACEHGANPDKGPHFAVRLEPGDYEVQWGQYGRVDSDPSLILFRFVPGVPVPTSTAADRPRT
jgi:hypothetical protein